MMVVLIVRLMVGEYAEKREHSIIIRVRLLFFEDEHEQKGGIISFSTFVTVTAIE
jgi:hypothetical protein